MASTPKTVCVSTITEAYRRIVSHVRRTPLQKSEELSRLTGAEVYFKLECQQETGSFKVRGAVNKVSQLAGTSTIVTASSGNHAKACAFAIACHPQTNATIYLPENVVATKREALATLPGIRVALHGTDMLVTETEARRVAGERNQLYVSPYNDLDIVCGQGTVAIELLEQAPGPVDAVFVPVGGGGLIGGIATYIKGVSPTTHVVGCSPAASAVMADSVVVGHIVDPDDEDTPTLSDGTAGGIEHDSITFDLCVRHVDAWERASEQEIAHALAHLLTHEHIMVEGAAAMALACFVRQHAQWRGKRIVVVLCGANLGTGALRSVLADDHNLQPLIQ